MLIPVAMHPEGIGRRRGRLGSAGADNVRGAGHMDLGHAAVSGSLREPAIHHDLNIAIAHAGQLARVGLGLLALEQGQGVILIGPAVNSWVLAMSNLPPGANVRAA